MREKNLAISFLLDFYGEVLTDKQKQVLELYYNDDLSLAEIAEHEQITRQGVRDAIKRGEATLLHMEEKLRLAKKYSKTARLLEKIDGDAKKIEDINEQYCFSKEIGDLASEIQNTAQNLRVE